MLRPCKVFWILPLYVENVFWMLYIISAVKWNQNKKKICTLTYFFFCLIFISARETFSLSCQACCLFRLQGEISTNKHDSVLKITENKRFGIVTCPYSDILYFWIKMFHLQDWLAFWDWSAAVEVNLDEVIKVDNFQSCRVAGLLLFNVLKQKC